MPGSETWTTPQDWTASTPLPAATLNTHLRDNLTYLKGVLGGSDLQNVAIHANRTLSQGGMRVHRHPFANHRHIESGSAAMTAGSLSVTFADAYAVAPAVVAMSNAINLDLFCSARTTTGCTITASGASTQTICWIAEGQD
jgi:hypothetical protein